MKAWKLALAVIGFALVLGPVDQPNAQGGSVFTLKLCNRSNEDIQLALIHRVSPTDNRFRIRGWFDLPRGCYDVTGLPRGWVYWFGVAKSGKGFWGGKATDVCIGAAPFDRVSGGGYECKPDEQLVGFAGNVIDVDVYTVTFNP